MTKVEKVEAIKVLTETLQVLEKLLFMSEEENKKGMKMLRDKIFHYIKHI